MPPSRFLHERMVQTRSLHGMGASGAGVGKVSGVTETDDTPPMLKRLFWGFVGTLFVYVTGYGACQAMRVRGISCGSVCTTASLG